MCDFMYTYHIENSIVGQCNDIEATGICQLSEIFFIPFLSWCLSLVSLLLDGDIVDKVVRLSQSMSNFSILVPFYFLKTLPVSPLISTMSPR